MAYIEQEWRDLYKRPGGHGTVMSDNWLRAGCPRCGCKKFEATGDCWVYCEGCKEGFATAFPFTESGEIITSLDFSKEEPGT